MITAIAIYAATCAVAFVIVAIADVVHNEFPVGFRMWLIAGLAWPVFLSLFTIDLIWDEGNNP